jgi:hypothetical protein
VSAKGYVYAPGEVPVLLVAHLDTVHKTRVTEIFYSGDGNRLMSPQGIGGDDRAGVHIIFQVLQNSRCHVLFCEDEEIGAVGAREFAKSAIRPKVRYIIEVDRRGANDAVFYGCDNQKFTDFVCGFGFTMERGSFSDISVIAPRLGIAAVNLSAGYHNEHTRSEFVDLAEMASVTERIDRMVNTQTGKFKYIERVRPTVHYNHYEQQVMDLWGYMGETHSEKKELLMPLPEATYLIIDGHPIENRGDYYIDSRSNVYDFVHDLGAAVKSENTSAHTTAGPPLRFCEDDAYHVKVISLERALEMLKCS